jgi:transposase, IS6 family
MNQQNPFKWRHFEAEMMLLCVRWELRYSRSCHLEELMRERGLLVEHSTISRWVQRSAPELDKGCQPHLKACNDCWKVDETSIQVRKTWRSLYRAVDSQGTPLEFLLSPTREAGVAKRFFLKALHSPACSAPHARPVQEPEAQADPSTTKPALRVINVEKNAAAPKAEASLKAAGILAESVELKPGQRLE